jgi:hypothetical protein
MLRSDDRWNKDVRPQMNANQRKWPAVSRRTTQSAGFAKDAAPAFP